MECRIRFCLNTILDKINYEKGQSLLLSISILKNKIYCDFIFSNCITNRENIKGKRQKQKTWWSFINLKHQPCLWVAFRLLFVDIFPNYFCHSELCISSQMSIPDFIMPLCNHSCHNVVPQEVCPWVFPYLGIQVTWACWCFKRKIHHH